MSLSELHLATVPGKTRSSRSKTKQLSRKLSALQSKLETESEVFQQKMGYRLSYADKMKCEAISDLVQEKEKIKLELKDLTKKWLRKKERKIEHERDRLVQQLDAAWLERTTSDQIVDEGRDIQSTRTESLAEAGLYEGGRAVRRRRCSESRQLPPSPSRTSSTPGSSAAPASCSLGSRMRTWSFGHLVIWSLNHSITGSPGHLVTWSQVIIPLSSTLRPTD